MTTDWKQRCIDTFQLLPAPSSFREEEERSQDDNNDNNDANWKAYHDARVHWNERKTRFESFQREPELLEQWEQALLEETNKSKATTLLLGANISMDIKNYVPTMYADSGIQTVEYHAILWSPYFTKIPRAVLLVHKYHRKADWKTMEFSATWSYRILGREHSWKEYTAELLSLNDDTNHEKKGAISIESISMTPLCSCCYEDEELQADVINTDGLTLETVAQLKECLLGVPTTTTTPTNTVDDLSFLKLLFASMATPNFRVLHDDGVNKFIGHTWKPEQGGFLRERLVEEGILEFEDDDISITWLEYHVRRLTNHLLPIDKYYKPFHIRDAPGYYAYQQKQKGN